MSLKIHFLHCNLDYNPPNFRTENDEHGESFHENLIIRLLMLEVPHFKILASFS